MDIKTKNLPETGKECCGYNFLISTPSGVHYNTCPICDNIINLYSLPKDIDATYCNKCIIQLILQ